MNYKNRALIPVILCGLGLLLSVISSSCFEPRGAELPENYEEGPKPSPRQYGISVSDYTTQSLQIQRNEFLATILQKYGINPTRVHAIVEKSKPVFDVRAMHAGNTYTVFSPEGHPDSLHYLVYEKNPVEYVVYDLRDSIRIYAGRNPVRETVAQVADTINGSLYEVLQKNGADPDLAVQMADVFGSVIDFYRINKGDWFKVSYKQQSVNDKPLGAGRILSAVFYHDGKTHKAFYFQGDSASKGGYYDGEGKSLRRKFLKAPLKYSRISSRYTKRRFHPVQRVYKAHLGTDYAAPTGTPIVSTANGVVIASTYSRFNGNYVKIKHDKTYTTQYLHMSRRAVRKGQRVNQGQVIGYVGSTGLATGPHVCYRFWKNGRQVDALKQNFKSAEPLLAAQMPAFKQLVQREKQVLENLTPGAGQPTRFAMYQSRNQNLYRFFGIMD